MPKYTVGIDSSRDFATLSPHTHKSQVKQQGNIAQF